MCCPYAGSFNYVLGDVDCVSRIGVSASIAANVMVYHKLSVDGNEVSFECVDGSIL